jgi:hypothetical protein
MLRAARFVASNAPDGDLAGLQASDVTNAVCLTGSDVDLTSGLLTVRDAKFGWERYVPLHPSKTEALRRLLPLPWDFVVGPELRLPAA